jgi:uncharacterized protein
VIADSELMDGIREALAKQPGLVVGYVFGSVAKGRDREGSDIDVAVQFDSPLEFDAAMDLQCELERVSGRPVDLVQLQQAPIELQFAIISDRGRLLERSQEERIDVEARIMSLYADARPRLEWQFDQAMRGPNRDQREERIGAAVEFYRRTAGELNRALAAAPGRVPTE